MVKEASARADVATDQPSRAQRPIARASPAFAALVGASIWGLSFWIRFRGIPGSFWQWRDDALITLSEAKNLVQFGTVGLSPGTGRVEAFSTPLQFGLAVMTFSVHQMSYMVFLDWYVGVSIAVIGALVGVVLFRVARLRGISPGSALLVAGPVTLLAAIATVTQYTAAGWLVSGMENPLVVVCGLLVVASTVNDPLSELDLAGAVVGLSLLGVARVELVLLVVPLILAVASRFWLSYRGNKRMAAALTVSVPIAFWGLVELWRFLYFGHLSPTSALAEGKSLGPLLILVIAVMSVGLCVPVGLSMLGALRGRGGPAASRSKRLRLVLLLVLGGSVVEFVRLLARQVPKGSLGTLFGEPYWWTPSPGSGLIWLLIVVALLVVVDRWLEGSLWSGHLVLFAVAMLPIEQFIAFGPARLDAHRISSLAVPFLSVWLCVSLIRVGWSAWDRSVARSHRNVAAVIVAGVVLAGFLVTGMAQAGAVDRAHDLCCKITTAPSLLTTAQQFQRHTLRGSSIPILANPDLGEVSYAKTVIVEDLGELGDPVLTQVISFVPRLLPSYLNDVALPDLVELHASWQCVYKAWTASPNFAANYQIVTRVSGGEDESCPNRGDYIVWQRRNAGPEYALTWAIRRSLHPDRVVTAALHTCSAGRGTVFRCEYVRRAVLRNAQWLQSRGDYASVVAAFRASPSALLDLPLLEGGSKWSTAAYRSFVVLAGKST